MKKFTISKVLLSTLIVFLSINLNAQYFGGQGRGDVMSERLDIQLDGEECVSSTMSMSQTTCSSFTLNDQTYTESGTYTQTFVNAEGCDSVITLFLSVETLQSTITTSACLTYELNSEVYTESGTYTQMLTNEDGCDSLITLNLTIGEGDAELAVSPDSPVSFCFGESMELVAEAGFDTYSWSNGAEGQTVNVNEAGVYTVSATAGNGCNAVSQEIIVNVIDTPVAGFNYEQTTGYTVDFMNTSSNGMEYLWDFGGGNSSTQESPSFTYPFEGIYPVTLIVSNDCGSDTIFQNVEVLKIVGINDAIYSLNYFEMFPNPSSGKVSIKAFSKQKTTYKLRVLNVLGQALIQDQFTMNGEWIKTYNFSELSSGVYWIVIEDQTGVMNRKFVLN